MKSSEGNFEDCKDVEDPRDPCSLRSLHFCHLQPLLAVFASISPLALKAKEC
jgi:hypothetical protein